MKTRTKLSIAISVFIITILFGSYIFAIIERWEYDESVYFTVMTMLTVGYGDFYPKTDIGKIFSVFFALFGISIALYTFSILAKWYFNERINLIADGIEKRYYNRKSK